MLQVGAQDLPSFEEQGAEDEEPDGVQGEGEELHHVARFQGPARAVPSEEDPHEDQDQRGDVEEDRQISGGDGISDPLVQPAGLVEHVADALEGQGNHEQIQPGEDQHEGGGRDRGGEPDRSEEQQDESEGCHDLPTDLRVLELPSQSVIEGFRGRRLSHVHAPDVVDPDPRAHDRSERFVFGAVGDEKHAIGSDLFEHLVELLREEQIGSRSDPHVTANGGNFGILALLHESVIRRHGAQEGVHVGILGVRQAELRRCGQVSLPADERRLDAGLDADIVIPVHAQDEDFH